MRCGHHGQYRCKTISVRKCPAHTDIHRLQSPQPCWEHAPQAATASGCLQIQEDLLIIPLVHASSCELCHLGSIPNSASDSGWAATNIIYSFVPLLPHLQDSFQFSVLLTRHMGRRCCERAGNGLLFCQELDFNAQRKWLNKNSGFSTFQLGTGFCHWFLDTSLPCTSDSAGF